MAIVRNFLNKILSCSVRFRILANTFRHSDLVLCSGRKRSVCLASQFEPKINTDTKQYLISWCKKCFCNSEQVRYIN